MSLSTQKEDFSYAYVYAVTASAGYSLQAATRRLDNKTSITLEIKRQIADRDYILALKA